MASEDACASGTEDGGGGLIVIEHRLRNPFVRVGRVVATECDAEGSEKGRMGRLENGFVCEGFLHDDFGVLPLGRADGPCGGVPEKAERECGAIQPAHKREGFFYGGWEETDLDSAVHIECLADFGRAPKSLVGRQ